MVRLLKADFYKLFRRKAFYICLLVCGLLAFITVATNVMIYNFSEKEMLEAGFSLEELTLGEEMTGFTAMVNITPSNWLIVLGVMISMFVCLDFSSGIIKNVASKGFKRFEMYLSKYIISIFCVIAFMIFQLIVVFISATFMSKHGIGEMPEHYISGLLATFGINLLIAMSIAAFFTMISFIVRKIGGSIAINLCTISFIGVIFKFIDGIIENVTNNKVFELSKYISFSYMDTFRGYDTTVYQSDIATAIIVSICWLIVATGVGIACFQNRDI